MLVEFEINTTKWLQRHKKCLKNEERKNLFVEWVLCGIIILFFRLAAIYRKQKET